MKTKSKDTQLSQFRAAYALSDAKGANFSDAPASPNLYLPALQDLLARHQLKGSVFLKPDLLWGSVAEESFNTGRYDDYVWISYDHPKSGYTFVHGVSASGEVSKFEFTEDDAEHLCDEGPVLFRANSGTELIGFLEDLLSGSGE